MCDADEQNGALAVAGGRDIVPIINELLDLPFALCCATQDWHPPDHISFASTHDAPNNKPFVSKATVTNPVNSAETQEIQLWPDHCVQNSQGAELLPELNVTKFGKTVKKGIDRRVEMYSAFADPFPSPCAQSDLADTLKKAGITDVFVAGLAADYCVKFTALDAQKHGFKTWVIGEATRAVDPSSLDLVYKGYADAGVTVIKQNWKADEQIQRVRALATQ